MSKTPHPQHLEIASEHHGETIFIRLSGEFDLAGEEHFDRTVQAAEQQARSIVVDLSEVGFIDSSGLRALLRVWQRACEDGHDLAVVPGSEQVRRTMRLTGLDGVLPFAEERRLSGVTQK